MAPHRDALKRLWSRLFVDHIWSTALQLATPVAEACLPAPPLGLGNHALDAVLPRTIQAGAHQGAKVARVAAAQLIDLCVQINPRQPGIGVVHERPRRPHLQLHVLNQSQSRVRLCVHGALNQNRRLRSRQLLRKLLCPRNRQQCLLPNLSPRSNLCFRLNLLSNQHRQMRHRLQMRHPIRPTLQ